MGSVTELREDDREAVDALIDAIIAGRASTSTTEVMREAQKQLRALAEGGQVWADRAEQALAVDGVRRRVETRLKAEQSSITIGHNGTALAVTIPARIGIRPKSRATDDTESAHQQALWHTVTWDEFALSIAETQGREVYFRNKRMAFEHILKLRDKYPDTLTPGAALQLEGIDPRDVRMSGKA